MQLGVELFYHNNQDIAYFLCVWLNVEFPVRFRGVLANNKCIIQF